MQGPKVFGILVLLILGLLLIEHAIVSWSGNKSPGVPGPEAPPSGGAAGPSNSTLTHGRQVDTADSRPVEAAARAARTRAQEEFALFLEETARKLPTFADARGLNAREAHGHPAILNAAAAELGELAERIERDPSLRPQALGFYQACALNAELFRAVRALCFNRAQLLHADLHHDIWSYDPARIPQDVIDLAKTF